MANLIEMTIISTTVGNNPLENVVNKRFQNTVLGCSLKNERMISACFQGKPFKITVIQVYALTTNAEEVKLNHPIKT